MRKFQLVLAYYTLLVSGGLFFWSIFLGPKPFGFLIALLMIPIGVYFWIIVLGKSKIKAVEYPKEAKSEAQLARLSLVILFTILISTSSMFAFSFINTKLLAPITEAPSSVSSRLSLIEQQVEGLSDEKEESTEKILDELEDLKKTSPTEDEDSTEEALSSIDKSKLLGVSEAKMNGVTIKSKDYSNVNVYKEKNSTSEIVGQAEFGKTYTFLDKSGEWYLILFTNKTDTMEGFINSQFVKEVEY